MSMDIGQRLKALRGARNLSQRQLAELSGITNGMISMVEQNRTSPSVSTLKKILDGISVSMAEFFAAEAAGEEKIFFRHDELREITPAETGDVRAVFRQVGDVGDRALQMLYERYEPGADTGEDLYAHEAEEAGIVISGRIEVTVGDRVANLGPGDAYLFDSRLPHRFRNTDDAPCIIVSACTPPTF